MTDESHAPAPAAPNAPAPATLTGADILAGAAKLLEAARPFAAQVGQATSVDAARARVESAADSESTILIVGEPSRGKSSLVRAILNRWDLPVETRRRFYVTYTYAESDESLTCRYTGGVDGDEQSDEPREVRFGSDAFAKWPDCASAAALGEEQLSSAQFALHTAPLDRLRIVDAPGVAGLHGPAAELSLSLLPHADALVFVADCSAPLSAHEIAFLARAGKQIGIVFLVVAKRDLYQGWAQIVDEDRALLKQHVPSFAGAPLIAVSSTLAYHAAIQPPERASTAKLLRTQAGLDPLTQLIAGNVIEGRDRLRALNAVLVTRRLLATVDHAMNKVELAVSGDSAALDELAVAEQTAKNAVAVDPSWTAQIHSEVYAVNTRLEVQIAERFAIINDEFADAIMNGPKEELEHVPENLATKIAAVVNELRDWVYESLVDAAKEAVSTLSGMLDADDLSDDVEHEGQDFEVAGPNTKIGGPRSTQTRMSMLSQFSTGRSLGGMIHMATPLGFASGVAMAVVGHKISQGIQERTELRTWLTSTLSLQRTRMSAALRLEIQAAEGELVNGIRSQLDQRTRELQETITRLRETAANDEAGRKEAVAGMQTARSEFTGLRKQCEALLAALQHLPASAEATTPR